MNLLLATLRGNWLLSATLTAALVTRLMSRLWPLPDPAGPAGPAATGPRQGA
jgi:hypothetical protein